MDNLKSRIKQRRKNIGLSQAKFAAATGVSQPTVANWENGSHIPRQNAIKRISQALDVDESWLLLGDSPRNHTAQDYLAQPIRHVPIHSWPTAGKAVSDTAPIGYFPYPSQEEHTFALMAQDKQNDPNHVMIFDHNTQNLSDTDSCLWSNGHETAINQVCDIPLEANIIGRLKTDIKSY